MPPSGGFPVFFCRFDHFSDLCDRHPEAAAQRRRGGSGGSRSLQRMRRRPGPGGLSGARRRARAGGSRAPHCAATRRSPSAAQREEQLVILAPACDQLNRIHTQPRAGRLEARRPRYAGELEICRAARAVQHVVEVREQSIRDVDARPHTGHPSQRVAGFKPRRRHPAHPPPPSGRTRDFQRGSTKRSRDEDPIPWSRGVAQQRPPALHRTVCCDRDRRLRRSAQIATDERAAVGFGFCE